MEITKFGAWERSMMHVKKLVFCGVVFFPFCGPVSYLSNTESGSSHIL